MFAKLTIGAALVLGLGLAGGTWATAAKTANCCYPGAECCFPGSACCDDCCSPGSPCCYPGSPCCGDAPKAKPTEAGAKKLDCCSDPTCPPGCSPDCAPNCCERDKVKAAPKPAGEAKCDGGKCATNCKAD